jgi:hypothetical protein
LGRFPTAALNSAHRNLGTNRLRQFGLQPLQTLLNIVGVTEFMEAQPAECRTYR